MMMNKKKNYKTMVVGLLFLLCLAVAVFVYWQVTQETLKTPATSEKTSLTTDTAVVQKTTETTFSVKTIDGQRSTKDIHTSISIDFPQSNNEQLRDHIIGFIIRSLTNDYTWGGNKRPTYRGDRLDGQAIVDFFIDNKVREIAHERTTDSIGGDSWNEDISIKKCYEDPHMLSYLVSFGGDHGGVADGTSYGVTFDKVKGHEVTVFRDKKDDRLKNFLWHYVEKHMGEDYLTLYFPEELESHPVPQKPVYLTADGVHLVYQKYEIGPGAMGLLEIVVPSDQLADYMTEDARSLVYINTIKAKK